MDIKYVKDVFIKAFHLKSEPKCFQSLCGCF